MIVIHESLLLDRVFFLPFQIWIFPLQIGADWNIIFWILFCFYDVRRLTRSNLGLFVRRLLPTCPREEDEEEEKKTFFFYLVPRGRRQAKWKGLLFDIGCNKKRKKKLFETENFVTGFEISLTDKKKENENDIFCLSKNSRCFWKSWRERERERNCLFFAKFPLS